MHTITLNTVTIWISEAIKGGNLQQALCAYYVIIGICVVERSNLETLAFTIYMI
jgi:hypothetical protein